MGATDKDLAAFFEVNETTINQWKKDHIEFSKSLKKGKILADAEVADKLYKRATGYETPDGKYYPPDTTAAIFWLKNRRPNLWRENQNINEEEAQAIPVKIEINVQDARIRRELEGCEESVS